jgi:hypothetical protein
MKPSRWLLPALFVSNAAIAAAVSPDPGPLRPEMFVRGGFNGWGTDNVLVHKGKGVYGADVLVGPGNHGFKVGSGDWKQEWVPKHSGNSAVKPGQAIGLQTSAGPEATLFVRRTGTYRFTLDAGKPGAPVLRVARLADAASGPAADPHAGHARVATLSYATHDGKRETARFSLQAPEAQLRSYTHSTTLALRDPMPQHSAYSETAELPYTRSGNLAFDALFALAGSEMRQNAVGQIRDGNYNGGAPIPCDCFETGEKWHYVWTRDLSYAADLGLALLDPARVRNSLDFKLSGYRKDVQGLKNAAPQVAGSADGLQVVQDTGSGGSWPVSTDRLTWAFAAEETLRHLPAAERAAFAQRALAALANTIENDRIAAFDPLDGLYTGEQSFLDWRDQSYAAWIPGDLASMSSAKALSTNVVHYQALRFTAKLAREAGDAENSARAARYDSWASDLKQAINARLWLQDEGMYSSLTAGHLDGAPLHKFDWLGQALAIVTGVADAAQARSILSRYPHGPMGAPVIWPQQPGVPVYHNRALWPFVTGYGLKAAAFAGNAAVADAAYESLMRGAALNMSNMENLEWLSGQPLLLDEKNPSLIGPVINSRRQLWSAGAYLGMVIEQVFGVSATDEGIALRPFMTTTLRRETFKGTDQAALHNLRLRGQRMSVRLLLPPASSAQGYHPVERVLLNGALAGTAPGTAIPWAQLKDGDVIEIALGAPVAGASGIRRVHADPYRESPVVFGPREPVLEGVTRDAGGRVRLRIGSGGNGAGVVYHLYRDGRPLARNLAAGAWVERGVERERAPYACYAVEAQFTASGNRSHHSAPLCVGPAQEIAVTDARVSSNLTVRAAGGAVKAPHLAGWGRPRDRFEVRDLRIDAAGDYRLQVRYANLANQINLGVSGGVKWLMVLDAAGRTVAQGVVQLPHTKPDVLALSTPLAARLAPGAYRIRMSDFYNMSYLVANAGFSGAGGTDGPSNRVDIVGVRLQRVN